MVVVRCVKGTETAEPVTMADFGDVLDFFAWFGSRFQNPLMRPLLARFPVPAAQQPEVVAGVVVHCEAMVSMKNSPSQWSRRFEPVLVDGLDPIRGGMGPAAGEICELSRVCGMALRVWMMPRPSVGTGAGSWEALPGCKVCLPPNSNCIEQWLTFFSQLNKDAATLMNAVTANHLEYDGPIGDVLVVRVDDGNLTVLDMAAMLELARKVQAGQVQPTAANFRVECRTLQRQWDGLPPVSAEEALLEELVCVEEEDGRELAGQDEMMVPVESQTLPALEHCWL